MTTQELKDRLDKILWVCLSFADLPRDHEGKKSFEGWKFHAETIREALKQLAPKA